MSTQLLKGSTDAAKAARLEEAELVSRLVSATEALEQVEDAVLDGRVSLNEAYRFKVLECIFDFLDGNKAELIDAASRDFAGKAPRSEIELEFSLTLAQVASVLEVSSKPGVSGGPLPVRFDPKTKQNGQTTVASPLGSVLVAAQHKRPFDDLFAPLASAVAAGNVVCAVLSPTLPAVNEVVAKKLTTKLPLSAVIVVSPASMPEYEEALSLLQAGEFGAQVPGTNHVARLIETPASAYVSASIVASPSKWFGGVNDNKIQAAATQLVDAASHLVGRSVGCPKLVFAHEEVFEQLQAAVTVAVAQSAPGLAPRDDGTVLREVLSRVDGARLIKPLPSEKAPGSIGVVSVDVEAARTGASAFLARRELLSVIKNLPVLVLVGVTSNEHAFSIIEDLGLEQGHMAVYSDDDAEVQHVLRETRPASLSVNHVAVENVFSSYAPRSKDSRNGIRWSPSLFETPSSVLLPAARPGSLGLVGLSSHHQKQQLVRKALALRLAKTKKLANKTRPTVSAPLLRVFFLQGLFLFWGTAFSGILLGLGYGTFRVSRWAYQHYLV
ncbi:hypothetical protein BCV70DRAFT_202900 [Testicularia cyperi]|uniref:Aldehyde dehydrogenase domain-containing protein n=1 Tax=Testicularia cyperi TaxID=1882483 RepID=A0A317XHV5_9BASI|nr:hypothetical protein BCV70DRAFT_202900 [Testicularia cyperi]